MKNLHKILSSEPTKKGDIAVGIGLRIWDGEGEAPHHSYNLYITKNEAIKKGDWVFNEMYNEVYKIPDNDELVPYESKIILTTDEKLISDGVQPIPNDFLEWFIDNPKCEEVEVKMENYYASGALQPNLWQYKIVNPKEEPTIEEAKIMYSEAEVYNILQEAMKDNYTCELENHYSGDYRNLKKWFEQNKKTT